MACGGRNSTTCAIEERRASLACILATSNCCIHLTCIVCCGHLSINILIPLLIFRMDGTKVNIHR